jgi:hypothetical protein
MLLLFVDGVMSLLWIAAITAFVLAEKLAPYGVRGGRSSGVALVLVVGGLNRSGPECKLKLRSVSNTRRGGTPWTGVSFAAAHWPAASLRPFPD